MITDILLGASLGFSIVGVFAVIRGNVYGSTRIYTCVLGSVLAAALICASIGSALAG